MKTEEVSGGKKRFHYIMWSWGVTMAMALSKRPSCFHSLKIEVQSYMHVTCGILCVLEQMRWRIKPSKSPSKVWIFVREEYKIPLSKACNPQLQQWSGCMLIVGSQMWLIIVVIVEVSFPGASFLLQVPVSPLYSVF